MQSLKNLSLFIDRIIYFQDNADIRISADASRGLVNEHGTGLRDGAWSIPVVRYTWYFPDHHVQFVV